LEVFAKSGLKKETVRVLAVGVRQLDFPVEDGRGAPIRVTAEILQQPAFPKLTGAIQRGIPMLQIRRKPKAQV
jgi:hypothetical protein